MRQATKGVRDVTKNEINQTKILSHFDNGTKSDRAAWWFSKAEAYEIDFDMIGLSFYPLTHNGASLKIIEKFLVLNVHFPNKEIMLVETAYPYRKVYDISIPLSHDNPPFSIEGQLSHLQKAIAQMHKISNSAGVCWWGAFFINDAIEPCPYTLSSQALFDRNGVALPALTAFMDG